MGEQSLPTLAVEYDCDIETFLDYLVAIPQRLLCAAERIGEMVVQRQVTAHELVHPLRVLRVVVELHERKSINQSLVIIRVDVRGSVETDARLHAVRRTPLHKRLNLSVKLIEERHRCEMHRLRLAYASILRGCERTTTCGVEADFSALGCAELAQVSTSDVSGCEVEYRCAIPHDFSLGSLGVGEGEQAHSDDVGR